MIFVKRHICAIGILLTLQSFCCAQESKKAVSLIDEAQVLYTSAMAAKKNNDFLRSREYLVKIIDHFPKYSKIEEVKKEWGRITFILIHSGVLSPESVLYKVLWGDSLEKIAKKYRTTIELIKQRNGLKENNLKEGQELSIWDHPFTIIVDKGTNKLWLRENKNIVKEYHVSTGKMETITPLGEFTIKYRYPFPTWYHRGEVVPGGREDNWLGTRWLGFDKPKYGIHGTIYPQLIGQSVSGGCIRMKNEDVEELYDIVPVGTKVTIFDSHDKLKG
ncbi:MAG: L,D-transpeptidase family protein [Candidatus Omnitrophica bacterium]|nr:L,D-transpeptidase family protein [Candidatus Omnitrophota bacterium]